MSRKMVFILAKGAWRPARGIEIQRRVADDLVWMIQRVPKPDS